MLAGEFDVIVHGCNCQLAADERTTRGDRSKLGTISYAEMERAGRTFTVVNAYTQFHWRG